MRAPATVVVIALLAVACGQKPREVADRDDVSANESTPAVEDAEKATASQAVREMTIPAGTLLPVVLDTTVSSETSTTEQTVLGHVSRDVIMNDVTVLARGSQVRGVVTDATRSGRVKGRAYVAVRFDSVVPQGATERYPIVTGSVARSAESSRSKDALQVAAPAAGGALIGGLLGGGKGALIGTAAGAGAGTAVMLSTRGKEVTLAKGTPLRLKLTEPLTVHVPTPAQ